MAVLHIGADYTQRPAKVKPESAEFSFLTGNPDCGKDGVRILFFDYFKARKRPIAHWVQSALSRAKELVGNQCSGWY
jgi:hypothetical protein